MLRHGWWAISSLSHILNIKRLKFQRSKIDLIVNQLLHSYDTMFSDTPACVLSTTHGDKNQKFQLIISEIKIACQILKIIRPNILRCKSELQTNQIKTSTSTKKPLYINFGLNRQILDRHNSQPPPLLCPVIHRFHCDKDTNNITIIQLFQYLTMTAYLSLSIYYQIFSVS